MDRVLAASIHCPSLSADAIEHLSHDVELDQIRLEVGNQATTRDAFKLRAIKMKLWAVTLQQLGMRIDNYVEIDRRLSEVVRWNNLWSGGAPQVFTEEQMATVCKVVDDGYAVLEKYQKTASSDHASLAFTADADPIDPSTQSEIPWTAYKANENITGYNYGIQDIHLKPPVTQAFNRMVGKNTKTGVEM